VEYSRNLPGAAAAADRIVAALQAHGYDQVATRTTRGPIPMAETRYPTAGRETAAKVETIVRDTLRVYQPGTTSQLVEERSRATGPEAFVIRVPDSAAEAIRPLRMDPAPS